MQMRMQNQSQWFMMLIGRELNTLILTAFIL